MTLSFSEFNSTNKVDLLKQQLSMEEETDLANFNPPKKAIIQSKNDSPINADKELKHNEEINNEYYSQYLPQSIDYNHVMHQEKPLDMNIINNKLDYLITLLEEQKEVRTDTILEELILYIFFGIFIIYIINSFTKVKHYSR